MCFGSNYISYMKGPAGEQLLDGQPQVHVVSGFYAFALFDFQEVLCNILYLIPLPPRPTPQGGKGGSMTIGWEGDPEPGTNYIFIYTCT
jgi:hypothetical protein